MTYTRELIKAERQNEQDLAQLQSEYDDMTRLQRIRHFGVAVDLSNRIARIEGVLRERRRMFDFPHHSDQTGLTDNATANTFVVLIENE
jgi:hypothetical protein